MIVIEKGYGVYCGQDFARLGRDVEFEEVVADRRGNAVYGYIVNDGVSQYLPTGRIKVRTIRSGLKEV